MLRVIRIGVALGVFFGAAIGTHALAAQSDSNNIQHVASTLQQQISTSSQEMHQALLAQHNNTQQAIMNMHKEIQAQVAHLQSELQQMQVQLTNEIKTVQSEVEKTAAAAPVPEKK